MTYNILSSLSHNLTTYTYIFVDRRKQERIQEKLLKDTTTSTQNKQLVTPCLGRYKSIAFIFLEFVCPTKD